MLSGVGAGAALILALGASASGSKIAVVVTGADPAAAGAVQAGITRALEPQSVLPAATVAGKLGVAEALPDDAATRKQARALLDAAANAYYDDKYEELNTALAKLDELPTTAAERVEGLLWRTAVYVALHDEAGAHNQARRSLVLAPDLAVDVKLYPPAVRDAVAEARKSLATAKMTITGTPPGATITLDDRKIGTSADVPIGTHALVAAAPGFRRVTRAVDLAAGPPASIDLPLAIALDGKTAAALADATESGRTAEADALAEKLGADAIVFADVREKSARAVVWWKRDGSRLASARETAMPDGATRLGAWAAAQIRTGSLGARDATWILGERAGVESAFLLRRVSGGAAVTIPLGGAGPMIALDLSRGAWSGDAVARVTSFALSRIDVGGPAGTTHASGGTMFAGELGVDRVFGARDAIGERPRALRAGLALRAGRYASVDPRGPFGSLGLLPSFTRLDVQARGGATALVRDVTLDAGLGVSPWGLWSDAPAGSLGRTPRPLGATLGLGASWPGARRLRWSLAYRFDLERVAYSGTGAAATSPAFSGATLLQQTHTITFTAERGR